MTTTNIPHDASTWTLCPSTASLPLASFTLYRRCDVDVPWGLDTVSTHILTSDARGLHASPAIAGPG